MTPRRLGSLTSVIGRLHLFRAEAAQPPGEFVGELHDDTVRGRLAARLKKLQAGLWGDSKSVGGGVIELREHFGSGGDEAWRRVVVVLAGGDKSSQSADIAKAIALAEQI